MTSPHLAEVGRLVGQWFERGTNGDEEGGAFTLQRRVVDISPL